MKNFNKNQKEQTSPGKSALFRLPKTSAAFPCGARVVEIELVVQVDGGHEDVYIVVAVLAHSSLHAERKIDFGGSLVSGHGGESMVIGLVAPAGAGFALLAGFLLHLAEFLGRGAADDVFALLGLVGAVAGNLLEVFRVIHPEEAVVGFVFHSFGALQLLLGAGAFLLQRVQLHHGVEQQHGGDECHNGQKDDARHFQHAAYAAGAALPLVLDFFEGGNATCAERQAHQIQLLCTIIEYKIWTIR